MAQAPYPLPVDSLTENLVATAKATAREIITAPSLLLFLISKQMHTLGGLPNGVKHPDTALIQIYVEEVILDHMDPPW